FSIVLPSYSPRLDLHSFPTRRSSDLRVVHLVIVGILAHGVVDHTGDATRAVAVDVHGLCREQPFEGPEAAQRPHLALEAFDHQISEEHTSELQSGENLVCRLLLAKKN